MIKEEILELAKKHDAVITTHDVCANEYLVLSPCVVFGVDELLEFAKRIMQLQVEHDIMICEALQEETEQYHSTRGFEGELHEPVCCVEALRKVKQHDVL